MIAPSAASRRHSIPSGDVVLCNPPPYSTQPWLSMGVVLHYALLAEAGIRARIVRPLDPPFDVPPAVLHASLVTLSLDPTIEERLGAMEAAYRAAPGFFDAMVDELLVGGEDVVALSIFRNNVDATLQIAKLVKARRPSVLIAIGGPEAIEDPDGILCPWIDVVVGRGSEATIVPLFRSLLDRDLESAAALPGVYVNPAHGTARRAAGEADTASVVIPRIPFAPLLPLLVGDEQPTVPLQLNWGCPYQCAFCSNRAVYGKFRPGSADRLLDEIDEVVAVWESLHDGRPPPLNVQLSDATTNALPAQFDELLRGVAERQRRWKQLPHLRGQTLFDSRMTDERARLMREARFRNTFFGVDASTDSFRRSLMKPGGMQQVAEAIRVWHRSGIGGLTMGFPVGVPGETTEAFAASQAFAEWAMQFAESFESVTVLPYTFFRSAQDNEFASLPRSPERGVAWRADDPAGDPALRAERFMRLFDAIDGRVPTVSPIPPYIALPAMLGRESNEVIEPWMVRHGRNFDQITPTKQGVTRRAGRVEVPSAIVQLARLFETNGSFETWTCEGTVPFPVEQQQSRGLVILFRRSTGEAPVAVHFELRDDAKRAFERTRSWNVSYLKQWHGEQCAFDEKLVRGCARLVAQREQAG